jgi:hypothetical protein
MWTRALALIALAPALASAKTSVLAHDARAGDPTPEKADASEGVEHVVFGQLNASVVMDKLRVAVTDREGTTTVRLAITVSSTDQDRRQATIPLGLPVGARIVDAAVTIGSELRTVTAMVEPGQARDAYQRAFDIGRDPLLVELVDDARDAHAIPTDAMDPERARLQAFAPAPPHASEGAANYVLRAFPLENHGQARIELTLELPSGTAKRLVIDHAARIGVVEVERRKRQDVRSPIAFDLPAATRGLPAGVANIVERGFVDATRSLYAGWAPRPVRVRMPTVVVDSMPMGGDRWVDKGMVKRRVKEHMAQLGRCYEAVTQFQGGPEGTAVMHWLIDTSGTPQSITVDGEIDDPRITSCLAEQVAQWQFPAGDTNIVVNYPLHFAMAVH